MTKQEFEERAGIKVSDSQYKKIETVYAFHPSIDEVAGKDQIAYLYKTFGICRRSTASTLRQHFTSATERAFCLIQSAECGSRFHSQLQKRRLR